ncbi:hypothetical protein TrST_g2 [Triparma strigata]|uniref:Uncharacterized protein n=1 Tax=Triparma strigata TaxID=1606541 RepID=A0A9W7AQU3_9STRA|nr:hypothetical protein TrST_g2 [Triparma strigata]
MCSKKFYDEFIEGCSKAYSRKQCETTERQRIQQNNDQPKKMTNYTSLGYSKTRFDPSLFSELLTFYETHKSSSVPEKWPAGNTFTNHWSSPTLMVSLEDPSFPGGLSLKSRIWSSVQKSLEEWSGQKLKKTSLYGIRVYTEGSILAPHVDRNPLITSAIINVAQEGPKAASWPLEVYGHLGSAYNVTMSPGDLVLYESHSVIHGRPFPLEGSEYANVFVHFEPVDEEGNRVGEKVNNEEKGRLNLHRAAAEGDLERVKKIVNKEEHKVTLRDENDWQPVHEAARGDNVEVLQYLVSKGARIEDETGGGGGIKRDVKWWAKESGSKRVLEWLGEL